MKIFHSLALGFLLVLVGLIGSAQAKDKHRILFIPLDDRPPCLQFPEKMGMIAGIELISPPRALLGKFSQVGNSDQIIAWILQQDMTRFDAAIVSLDMIAFGGLVGSRVPEVNLALAQRRLQVLLELKKRAPQLPILASSVMMRLAPTADGNREKYREKLAKWAEISDNPTEKERKLALESDLPEQVRQDYLAARNRNHQVNRWAIDWLASGVFTYLILSQDDAKPKGMHIREREALTQLVRQKNVTDRVAIQPGADEVSMLLLGRFLSDQLGYRPKIKVIFSSEAMSNQMMPYEDRPLHQTVSFHIRATGAEETTDLQKADLLYFVFTSRHEKGRAQSFAQEVKAAQTQSKAGIILADVDPIGDIQGGDSVFTEALGKLDVLPKLYGYACWNTAGNTIGTALPHGLTYGYSVQSQPSETTVNRHQQWFLQNRLLDDFAYHSLVRPKALAYIRQQNWFSFKLKPEQGKVIARFCEDLLVQKVQTQPVWLVSPLQDIVLTLPWDRTFEAEIDFKLP